MQISEQELQEIKEAEYRRGYKDGVEEGIAREKELYPSLPLIINSTKPDYRKEPIAKDRSISIILGKPPERIPSWDKQNPVDYLSEKQKEREGIR